MIRDTHAMKHLNCLLATLAVAALAIPSVPALADEPVFFQPWAAAIKVSKGGVQIVRGEKTYPGHLGAKLKVNDAVVTSADGSVGMVFLDNSVLTMGPDTEVVLKRYSFDPTTYMGGFDAHVKRGTVSLQAGNLADSGPDNVSVTTPQAELKGNAKQLLISVGETK
ncbi:MAG: hypothetical protein WC073_01790 [Sterolibacterium sp.]